MDSSAAASPVEGALLSRADLARILPPGPEKSLFHDACQMEKGLPANGKSSKKKCFGLLK
jgi:hypothetical protein